MGHFPIGADQRFYRVEALSQTARCRRYLASLLIDDSESERPIQYRSWSWTVCDGRCWGIDVGRAISPPYLTLDQASRMNDELVGYQCCGRPWENTRVTTAIQRVHYAESITPYPVRVVESRHIWRVGSKASSTNLDQSIHVVILIEVPGRT